MLIIGGTVFLGRALVDSALARGHDVTLFNRGQHNPDLYPGVEKLRGDRDGNLWSLKGREWDAVIDTCGYVPRIVRQSVDLRVADHYTFISSISVYADNSVPGADESRAVGKIVDESMEEITGDTYGPLKALCENAVRDTYGVGALIIRPGLIVGPYDPSDRFTYWPKRIAEGGEVLVPDKPSRTTQIIDVRDLADWNVRMVEKTASGTFNATGPATPLTMGGLFDTCKAVSGSDATFTWVSEEFLLEHDVTPWTELPLWVPDTPDMKGFDSWDIGRALDQGLTFRPVEDTVAATLEWERTREPGLEPRAGLDRQKEEILLRAWRNHAIIA
ncbi:MAG: SDR family oxidoreductase [Chloroflexota bacterium]